MAKARRSPSKAAVRRAGKEVRQAVRAVGRANKEAKQAGAAIARAERGTKVVRSKSGRTYKKNLATGKSIEVEGYTRSHPTRKGPCSTTRKNRTGAAVNPYRVEGHRRSAPTRKSGGGEAGCRMTRRAKRK